MRLPKIGASVVVFWDDIVSDDNWQATSKAQGVADDHDFMESPGRFLGVDADDRLHLAQTCAFKDGVLTRSGTTYYIPMGVVRAIKPCKFPSNPPRKKRRKR
jgi:hypothetical protein